MRTATIKRLTGDDDSTFPYASSYMIWTKSGRRLLLRKEFYAQGPSLFTWVMYDTRSIDGKDEEIWLGEFATKRSAVNFIEDKL